MAYDIPVPSAYTHTVIANTARGYSIHFPDSRALGAGRDSARAEAALVRLLDEKTGGAYAPAIAPQFVAALADAPAPDVDKAHPAARIGLIVGGSTLLWAAIAYGVVSLT